MRTILTIKQQKEFLSDNRNLRTITHKWSARGMGSSRILDYNGDFLSKAGGCGYDRYGAALADFVCSVFSEEVLKLAKRECKGKRKKYKSAINFYGLHYNAENGEAWINGACGSECVAKVLNKIGFSLTFVGSSSKVSAGEDFYTLEPVNKHDKERLQISMK